MSCYWIIQSYWKLPGTLMDHAIIPCAIILGAIILCTIESTSMAIQIIALSFRLFISH